MLSSFRDLDFYRDSYQLALEIHQVTLTFPAFEKLEQGSQMRRASKRIPANIAEGFKKRGKADKVRFYNTAQGSLEECRYYMILTKDLGYGDTSELNAKLAEVSRMLEAYMSRLLDSQ